MNTEDWTTTKTAKPGNARVIDVDTASLKVLAFHKATRVEVSLELAKADAYVFGDDEGKLWQKAAANRFAAHLEDVEQPFSAHDAKMTPDPGSEIQARGSFPCRARGGT